MTLKHRYNLYNRKYWKGLLPKDTTVQWSKNIHPDAMAACHVHGLGHCDNPFKPKGKCKKSYIRIHPIFQEKEAAAWMSLLHEMVHISALLGNPLRRNHGPAFQKEMLRLAKAGAFRDIW